MFHFIHLTISSSSVPGPILRSRDTRANERNSASSSRAPLRGHNPDRGGIRDASLACNSGQHSLPGLPGRTEEEAGLGCFQRLEEAAEGSRVGGGLLGAHDETGKREVRTAAAGLVDGVGRGHPPGNHGLQTLVICKPLLQL